MLAKILRCKHIGPDATCQFVARGETEQDILEQVASHAKTAHGITEVPPELVQAALSNIQNEED